MKSYRGVKEKLEIFLISTLDLSASGSVGYIAPGTHLVDPQSLVGCGGGEEKKMPIPARNRTPVVHLISSLFID
jgi:hypothetical protein